MAGHLGVAPGEEISQQHSTALRARERGRLEAIALQQFDLGDVEDDGPCEAEGMGEYVRSWRSS
eukprot:14759462-Alexandrium_andersonii.AAC.1